MHPELEKMAWSLFPERKREDDRDWNFEKRQCFLAGARAALEMAAKTVEEYYDGFGSDNAFMKGCANAVRALLETESEREG